MKFLSIHFYTYEAPFKNPVKTPKIQMASRKVLVIALKNQYGQNFYGECNAFETNWYDNETISTVYHTLKEWFDNDLKNKVLNDFTGAQNCLASLDNQPAARSTAVMALYQAFNEMEFFSASYGATVNGLTTSQLEVLKATEPARIKLKWSETVMDDLNVLANLSHRPMLALDANESLAKDDRATLQAIAEKFDIIYVEEPFEELEMLKQIEDYKIPPAALDEKAENKEVIAQLVLNYPIKTVVLKPFRLGGIDRIFETIEMLHQNGIKVVIGGMYEYGLSRYFTAYLSQFGDYPGDITPDGYYFEEDFTHVSGTLKKGRIHFTPPVIKENVLKFYE